MKNKIIDCEEYLWMIPYFQGGYDEAKLYTPHSTKKVKFKCPICGRVKEKSTIISNLCVKHSIGCLCGDGIPYTEKVIFKTLEQLKVPFIFQYKKSNNKWCKNKIYDFYFEYNNEQFIIETHGIQHYEENNRKRARTLEKEQENDKLKKDLAINNGIKEENYIIIDCRKSELEFIKQNILVSRLNELFDLSKIDWIKIGEFALSNLVKQVCDYWNENNVTMKEISKAFGICEATVSRYLQKGIELNWVDKTKYTNNKNNSIKNAQQYAIKCNSKKLKIFKDGICIGIEDSTRELERISLNKYGVYFNHSEVSKVCIGKYKQYKGYEFEYSNEVC